MEQPSPAVVREVCRRLRREYGLPRHGNPQDPLDDLVYIVISNKTAPSTAERVYAALKRQYPDWYAFAAAPMTAVRRIMRPAGLAGIKARYLRAAIRRIHRDFGAADLRALQSLPTADAHNYLIGLPGVSDKVAKCVLMYTFKRKVLPVDTHVHRVATRLGWTVRKRADQAQPELEIIVPPMLRYAFHVDAIAHSRIRCRPKQPSCSDCCVGAFCQYRLSTA